MKARHLVIAAVLFALLAGSAAFAQTPPLYIKQFGSAQIDYVKGVVTDPSGNVYVAGTTHGAIGTTSQGVQNTNNGAADAFLAKLNADGEILWVTQFGSAADDHVGGIALISDLMGVIHVYVAGWTKGSIPGAGKEKSADASDSDIFLAKIHESGTIQWIRQSGTAGDDHAYGVAVDRSGLVYVVGSTTGAFSGNPIPTNGVDAFIARFDATGVLWTLTPQFSIASHPQGTFAYGVAVDVSTAADYIYVTGGASADVSGSIFVARFSPYLANLRTVTLGGPANGSESAVGRAVTVDSQGNVIVAGSTLGAFDGNAWSGGEDIVLIKFTQLLSKRWSLQYGTDSNDCAYGVAVDAENSIYVTGITGYPSTGHGLDGQTHVGSYDIFLSRFATEDGRRVFTRQVGSAMQEWVYGAAVDASGNVYVAGATEGTMVGQGYGYIDAVLIKYGPDGPVPRPVTEFFINGTVREVPSGSGLESVSITVKDELGQVVGDYLTDSAGQFALKVTKAGRYFVHKLKIGYKAQVDPDDVTVTETAPSAALTSYMEKIVVKTEMSFRKGYNTIRFTKLPAGDRSVNAVFGTYAGNPYVGIIFSFERPMQYLLLLKKKTMGNLTTIELGRSYMLHTSTAFTLDTTYWVSQEVVPATVLPSTKHRGKVSY